MTKQQVTIHLDRKTLRKLRILAARRGISIRGLLARQIEQLGGYGDVESYRWPF